VSLVLGLAGLLAACSNGGQVATAPADAAPSGILRPSSVAAIASVRQVHVSIGDAGCAPQAIQLPARPATFIVTNSGSATVLEYEIGQADRVIGEVENVVPGVERSFTLNLKPGAYRLSCPGGTTPATGILTVTK
jgi:iron uptake system component EfeO